MSRIIDSTVIIDGKEYVLFYTQSDFDYPDLEVALSVCLKSDLDKIEKEYSDMDIEIYEYIYPVRPFLDSYEDLKESLDGYFHVGDVCSFCDDCFRNNSMKSDYLYVCGYDEHEANDTHELYKGCKNPEKI